MNDDNLSLDVILKGAVMQIEKTLINDCLRLSKVSLKTLSVIIFVDINFSSIIIFVTWRKIGHFFRRKINVDEKFYHI